MVVAVLAFLLALLAVGQVMMFLTVDGKAPTVVGNGIYSVKIGANQPVEIDVVLTNVSKVTVAVNLLQPVIILEAGNGTRLVHGHVASFIAQGTVIIRALGLAPGQGLLMSVVTSNGSFVVINGYIAMANGTNIGLSSLMTYLHNIGASTELTLALVALMLVIIGVAAAAYILREREHRPSNTVPPPPG